MNELHADIERLRGEKKGAIIGRLIACRIDRQNLEAENEELRNMLWRIDKFLNSGGHKEEERAIHDLIDDITEVLTEGNVGGSFGLGMKAEWETEGDVEEIPL